MVRSLVGKHPNYFEAVLQLRDVTQEVVNFVEEELHRTKNPVPKVVEIKSGIDYFLADSQLTRALGKQLQQKFGGELTVTSSLHTKIDNKEKYRVTVLFRKSPFKKGDTVVYGGDEYVVKTIGKEIFLQDAKTGKKARVKYKDMKQIRSN
jgi:NMD protein affecting ribosome stability and mRNA decay